MSGRRALRSVADVPVPTPETADSAQTLIKGLAVLRAFQAGDHYLGNKEIAERTGITKPTVSRLAGTLVQLGYLRYNPTLGKYALGAAVLAIAYPMLATLGVRQVARPLMKQLADAIEGQVSMGTADGTSMVFIESSRSPRHRHTLPETGATIPMLASAMGRAYLAALHPSSREALVERLKRQRPDEWAEHGSKLTAALHDYLHLGFTRSFGDIRREMHACAVPLRTRLDGEITVVNCSVPAYRLRSEQLEMSIGPQLIALSRQIDTAMGQALQSRVA